MAKRLRIRDKLLFGLAVLGDLYFEVFEPISVRLGKIKGVIPPDYKASNLATAVSKMLATGDLEKIIKNGEPYLRITGRGQKSLMRDFPVFNLQRRKWDGLWRIVFYDIPEKEKQLRDRFQEKLKQLGFGMVQESVYITPFDIADDLREFLVANSLDDKVFVSVSKQLFAGNVKLLVDEMWKLGELNERYLEFNKKINANSQRDKILEEYEEILRDDPCLPKELLPEGWCGGKVHAKIKLLINKLP